MDEVICGDLSGCFITQKEGSGFASLEVVDTDDGNSFVFNEEQCIALYKYLKKKLTEDKLIL